eukprot:1081378-Rhodomonas_salina.4
MERERRGDNAAHSKHSHPLHIQNTATHFTFKTQPPTASKQARKTVSASARVRKAERWGEKQELSERKKERERGWEGEGEREREGGEGRGRGGE